MKKVKYRNNNYNSQVFSINYKFDSISPAGKCSGTALDLIKRYNELAKEAHSNGNYVEAEVFRQYAEHYRKIVTEINERKNARFAPKETEQAGESVDTRTVDSAETKEDISATDITDSGKTLVETKPLPRGKKAASKAKEASDDASSEVLVETKPKTTKKAFKVIEISEKTSTPSHRIASSKGTLKENMPRAES